MKVCWQVTGIRQDAWAQANTLLIEQDKSPDERGSYLHPEVHGHSAEKRVGKTRHPEMPRRFMKNQQ